MSTLNRQEDFAALTELHKRKLTGEAGMALSPVVLHRLQNQHLVDPDEYGDVHINERGEQHLRHLTHLGISEKKKKGRYR